MLKRNHCECVCVWVGGCTCVSVCVGGDPVVAPQIHPGVGGS